MEHLTRIKVRGYHLDIYGHVNNARYLEFLEEARWALMDEYQAFAELARQGYALVVVNINIDYRQPATFGQTLEIRSYLAHLGTRSARLLQRITRASTLVAEAEITFVVLDQNQRAAALDEQVLQALRQLPEPPTM